MRLFGRKATLVAINGPYRPGVLEWELPDELVERLMQLDPKERQRALDAIGGCLATFSELLNVAAHLPNRHRVLSALRELLEWQTRFTSRASTNQGD